MLKTKFRWKSFIFYRLIIYNIKLDKNMNTQNIETKIIFLPKSIELYTKSYNLLLKTEIGYVNLNIPKNINIHKKSSFIYIDVLNTDLKNQTWVFNLINLIKGFSRQYLNRIVLKGVGYKVFLNKEN